MYYATAFKIFLYKPIVISQYMECLYHLKGFIFEISLRLALD